MAPTEAPARPQHPLDSWPSKGYDGPQPWDHDALGIPREDRDRIGSSRNRVTPTISHNYPILTSGSADQCVHELGRKLGELGFPNSVSEGTNPFGLVDQTVVGAIQTFRAQYGVRPDPAPWGGDTEEGRRRAGAHIDPWTVEAILKAHDNEFGD